MRVFVLLSTQWSTSQLWRVSRKPTTSWFSFGSWLKTRIEKSQLSNFVLFFSFLPKKQKKKKQVFVTELRFFVGGRWRDMESINFLNSCYGIDIVAWLYVKNMKSSAGVSRRVASCAVAGTPTKQTLNILENCFYKWLISYEVTLNLLIINICNPLNASRVANSKTLYNVHLVGEGLKSYKVCSERQRPIWTDREEVKMEGTERRRQNTRIQGKTVCDKTDAGSFMLETHTHTHICWGRKREG